MSEMKWEKLLSPTRHDSKNKASEEESSRNAFQQDYDRIAFSSSFRRLGKKTQVHPLSKNDNVHSRLTHSLEVSSVGRSLGNLIGDRIKKKNELPDNFLPQDIGQIVQTACLAHDLGNPPFGHAGEEAIKAWFSRKETKELLKDLKKNQQDDLKNFEGNAQGLRIVTKLEYDYENGGMRLTYATLASMMKYPWTSDEAETGYGKFSSFQSERDTLAEIALGVGLVERSKYHFCRHPLAFLTEAADDICYRILVWKMLAICE
jgi:dGTPase